VIERGKRMKQTDSDLYNRIMSQDISENAAKVFKEKPYAWEYKFLACVLKGKFDRLQPYRWDFKYGIQLPQKICFNVVEMIDVISEKLEEFIKLTKMFSTLLNTALQEAIGDAGVPSDLDMIIYVSEQLASIYKQLLEWGLYFKSVQTDDMFENLLSYAEQEEALKKENEIIELRQKLNEAEEKIQELNKEVEDLSKLTAEIKDKDDLIAKAKSEIDELTNKCNELLEKIAQLENSTNQPDNTPESSPSHVPTDKNDGESIDLSEKELSDLRSQLDDSNKKLNTVTIILIITACLLVAVIVLFTLKIASMKKRV
jgi:methyl-accepting chemotaxis protein